MKRLSIVLVGAIAAAMAAGTLAIDAGGAPKKLRIIYTNDLSGDIKECP